MAKRGIKSSGVRKTADDLNIRERIFVREYLKDENGTRSAIAAGYSAKTAGQAASRLLKAVKIQREIVKATDKICDDLDVSVAQIVAELKKLAFFDPRKLFDADGRCKPITELDDVTAMAVAGMKTVTKVAGDESDGMVVFTDFKLADKGQNLERLGRYKKMFTDKLDVTQRVTLEGLVCGDD